MGGSGFEDDEEVAELFFEAAEGGAAVAGQFEVGGGRRGPVGRGGVRVGEDAGRPGLQSGAALLNVRASPERGRSSGVEHNLAKVGVEGSNPFARSRLLAQLAEQFQMLTGFRSPVGTPV